ncbi:hypothetical protein [Microcystis phage Me-ZS1]|nr:hypothetical protein [Microcystis phage Me-ZS1]
MADTHFLDSVAKPRLRYLPITRRWYCSTPVASGYAKTMELAYSAWRIALLNYRGGKPVVCILNDPFVEIKFSYYHRR